MRGMIGWTLTMGVIYAAVCLGAYFLQGRMLFFPHPANTSRVEMLASDLPGFSEITMTGQGGVRLAGYLYQDPRLSGDCPLVLYFGGNAEEALHVFEDMRDLPGVALAAVNYRGYGRSAGHPGEPALRADARTVYDTLAKGRSKVVVMGRSLGAVLAAELAAERPVDAAVLITPFDSILNVAKLHYSWLPVGLILRHPFDAVPSAREAQAPALFLVAKADDIAPVARARALFDAWAGPKEYLEIDGAGHNDIQLSPTYRRAMDGFLRRVLGH